ncbi:MAG: hypothetical protein KKC46_06320 [Proteobacteria bacterium]|nr:hypothetical protein [Pseudomonadota bacterium]
MWSDKANVSLERALIGALIMLLFAISCTGSEYTTQHFSFPPESKPHENDWQYITLVIVSSDNSPITYKSEKVVKIKIHDQNNNIFLDDDYRFTCASVRANVVWDKFEEIKIDLYEVGNKYAKGSYNEQLLNVGPTRLISLIYQYDKKNNEFKRTNREGTEKINEVKSTFDH